MKGNRLSTRVEGNEGILLRGSLLATPLDKVLRSHLCHGSLLLRCLLGTRVTHRDQSSAMTSGLDLSGRECVPGLTPKRNN